jgi:DDE superfamily endonuclease
LSGSRDVAAIVGAGLNHKRTTAGYVRSQLKLEIVEAHECIVDLLAPLGRKERRHWARVYIQGLLLDGERKSSPPLARRIPGAMRRWNRRRFPKTLPPSVGVLPQRLGTSRVIGDLSVVGLKISRHALGEATAGQDALNQQSVVTGRHTSNLLFAVFGQ